MKLNNKTYKICIVVFMLLAAALAAFRAFLLNANKYIDTLGLYTDTGMGNLFNSLTFVLIALTVVFALPLIKASFGTSAKANNFTKISALICSLMMLVLIISSFASLAEKFDILKALELVLCIPSVIYFFGICFESTSVAVNISGMFALLPALYAAVRAIRMFMDINTQINASQRSFTLLFIVISMMFFIAEAEFSIPLGHLEKTAEAVSKRTAKYAVFGIITLMLAIIFPLTYTFTVSFAARDFENIAYGLCDIAIGVYALARVMSVKN